MLSLSTLGRRPLEDQTLVRRRLGRRSGTSARGEQTRPEGEQGGKQIGPTARGEVHVHHNP